MTFLELCQALRREVGAAGTGPANVEGQSGEYARLVEWVRNEWIRLQERHERWRFSWARGEVELSEDFRDYALPADLGVLDHEFVYIGDTKINLITWEDFRTEYRAPSGQSVIRTASIAPDGLIHFESFPAEGATLEFEYWKRPQRLEANTDVPRCPREYHYAIVYAAMFQYGLYENAPEVVEQARYSFDKVYQEMVNRELPRVEIQGPLA